MGDGSAMASTEQLVENPLEHRDAFLAFIRQRVGDPDIAADVLQDSLLKALKSADQVRDNENAVAWFYRILRHTLVDLYRRRAVRYRALQVLQADTQRAPTIEEKPTLCACLETLLPTLKPEYAELIRAVDLAENRVEAVARRMGITPNTLNVRLHRARRQLHTRLLESCRACAKHACLDGDCATPAAQTR